MTATNLTTPIIHTQYKLIQYNMTYNTIQYNVCNAHYKRMQYKQYNVIQYTLHRNTIQTIQCNTIYTVNKYNTNKKRKLFIENPPTQVPPKRHPTHQSAQTSTHPSLSHRLTSFNSDTRNGGTGVRLSGQWHL